MTFWEFLHQYPDVREALATAVAFISVGIALRLIFWK